MTATPDTEGTPRYTLDNRWRAARERLNLLETAFDPYTVQHFDKVGVGPGWRCLDVGAGAGSVARMLAERVGADGHVLAVDLEPTLLANLAGPNLEVRRCNVVTDDLPEGEFDLVHTRVVLVHIAERDDVLPKLVRALRPGGVLLLEEIDLTPAFQMEGVIRQALEAVYQPLIQAGAALFWANSMPGWMAAAGVEDVRSTVDRMTFAGQSPLAQFFQMTFLQFIEAFTLGDTERMALEDGRALMLQPEGRYDAWDLVTAWGRRT